MVWFTPMGVGGTWGVGGGKTGARFYSLVKVGHMLLV